MLTLTTREMELRGIQSQVSKKTNNPYYLVYVEDVDNIKAFCFVCRDFNALPQGLKKGDIVKVTCTYNEKYKELACIKVEKVD